MKRKPTILQLSMTGKLVLLNLIVLLIFGCMTGIMLWAFGNIDELLTTTVARELAQIVENARMGRELSRLFAKTNLLLDTFYGKPDVLKAQGTLLAATADYLANRADDPVLKTALREFRTRLGPLLKQCGIINVSASQLTHMNTRLLADLTSLEELNSRALSAGSADVHLHAAHQQLALLILQSRQDALNVAIQFAAFDPQQSEMQAVTAMNALLDALHMKLRNFATPEPEAIAYHQTLYDDIIEYKRLMLEFHAQIFGFRKKLVEVHIAASQIDTLIDRLDQDVLAAASQMQQQVERVITASSRSVYGVAGIAMLLFSAATYLFFVFTIHAPMKAICTGIRNFGEGRLHTPIHLARTDEWSIIEEALNRMARDLGTSIAQLEVEISERRRAETTLRKTQAFFRNILNSMPSMILGVDADTRIIHWNTAVEQQTGKRADEIRNQPLINVFPDLSSIPDIITKALRDGMPQHVEKHMRYHDNRRHYEDIVLYPLVTADTQGLVIRIDDVTSRVQFEEVMAQTERMVTIGGLATGMAHEVNNPLAVILQGIQNIRRRLSPDIEANQRTAEALRLDLDRLGVYIEQRNIHTYLHSMQEAGLRAAHIVENMLNFTRDTGAQLTLHSLPDLLEQTLELAANDYELNHTYNFPSIDIVREYEADMPMVPCGGSRMQQVFLNLLKNGAQAMAELPDRPSRFIFRIVRDNAMIRVDIEDNGPGLTEHVRKRVFDPFFTTHSPDIGTGLGLAVAYFIITEHHGGTIAVESTPGEWTRFIIRLPLERPTLSSDESSEQ